MKYNRFTNCSATSKEVWHSADAYWRALATPEDRHYALFNRPDELKKLMKTCSYLLILLLICTSSLAHAGAVEKCVNSNGKITYTDKGCKSKETSKDAYLIGTSSSKKYTNAEKPAVNKYRVAEIGALTEQAITQCSKQAAKYFADSHPNISVNSEPEFQTIEDRSINGDKVNIVLSGVLRATGEKASQEMKIQCSASRSRSTDWVLVFKDSGAQGKPSTTAAAH